jgi:hypothetical protein
MAQDLALVRLDTAVHPADAVPRNPSLVANVCGGSMAARLVGYGVPNGNGDFLDSPDPGDLCGHGSEALRRSSWADGWGRYDSSPGYGNV